MTARAFRPARRGDAARRRFFLAQPAIRHILASMPIQEFSLAMDRILERSGPVRTIVSALSGGMDSVVLLHLLAGWRGRRPNGSELVAAHLNHLLRGDDSRLDLDFSRAFARGLGVDFVCDEVDVAALAETERLGIEEAGRRARYRFFHALAPAGDGLILTGHHADDQAETILLHLRRGAHRRGLSGMDEFTSLPVPPGMHVHVGRPLLRLGRERLHAYALERNLDWREDLSNRDSSYARNRIRHRVIPMLENVLPGFRARLLAKARILAEEERELAAKGRALVEALANREGGGRFFRLEPEAFAESERLLYAFRHLIEEEMGERLPYGAVLSRLARLAESGRLGESLSLPGRLQVRRERDGLFFFLPGATAETADEEMLLPDPPFDIVAGGLAISAAWEFFTGSLPRADRLDSETEWMNPAAIRWPLSLRAVRPGERIRPLGAPGSRKVQDILVDLKVPRHLRSGARVLADHAGAIWLWPFRLANRVRVPDNPGKALRFVIREA